MTDWETSQGHTEPRQLGRVSAVHGVVLDIDFAEAWLPPLRNLLLVQRPGLAPMPVEVESQPSAGTVRCLSLVEPSEVRRGLPVTDTGRPLTTPVGAATLGRVLNASWVIPWTAVRV